MAVKTDEKYLSIWKDWQIGKAQPEVNFPKRSKFLWVSQGKSKQLEAEGHA